MKTIGRSLGFALLTLLIGSAGSSPARVSAQATTPPRVVISEVLSSGNDNGTYAADWFEVTNVGTTPIDITGWKVDDNSNAAANAVALRGVTMLAPGKSAVFLEGTTNPANDAALIAAFSSAWFGSATLPDGMLVGVYGGSGVGLGGGGDAVNLFDSLGARVTGIRFGGAVAGPPAATFDNSARVGGTTLPLPEVTAVSTAGINGAFVSFNGTEVGSPGIRMTSSPLSAIDLSTYVRIGRFDLPEPTRTQAPPNNLLAQEASAVTYNWDTDTLFIVGDGGKAVVQVTKTGELIDTMTLALGGSPQGNEFYDPEGLAYIGGGRFVLVQERDRMAVQFTYVPGATLQRADTQGVTLGTFVENIGIEGLSYDPQTNAVTGPGFIMVKEISPEGLFQTNIDFAAGTATNGSPSTINSINLFDPALANLLDFADIFALSNLRPLRGQAQSGNLLVLSQEEARIVNIDRAGQIASALNIVSDPGNPLSVADQQHEGMTMDENGVLYVVSENGGGDINHPQLWVYAPSSVPNQPPTDIALTNVITTLAENTNTAARLRVANITVTDDSLGTNVLGVAGADADFFEADNSGLYIKAGTVLDFEAKNSYSIVVQVDDPSVGATPDATVPYTLTLTDIVDETPLPSASLVITEVAPWASGNSPYMADWFEVTNKGSVPVDITGWRVDDNSDTFASGVALNGITSIAPGESVIFIETGTPTETKALFLSSWFGANPPAGLQVGSYTGGGVGLSTDGDHLNLFDAIGNRVTGVAFGNAVTGFSFDNAAGLGSPTLPFPALTTTSVAGVKGAFLAFDGVEIGSPGSIAGSGVVITRVIISEVSPWSSTAANAAYAADWFEITNISPSPVDLTGWKMDDDSASTTPAPVALTGVTTLGAGQSAVFIEASAPATTIPAFVSAWFGASPPAGLLIGSYTGSGVGLGNGGDQVNLFDAAGRLVTGVRFAGSTPGFTFDNAAGIGGVTSPPPVISTLSATGVNGAFLAADGIETGSPGRIANPIVLPPLVITEVVPWSSTAANAAYAADWFEVTNVGTTPVNVTGFKMDDESASFGSAVALNGVTTIAAGESVIFIESATPATTVPAFLNAWFGANPPAGLQVGTYTGTGVGLGNGGDQVHLFDAAGHRVTAVIVGASTAGRTFDNAAGAGAAAPPFPTIATLSIAGVNGAFLAADGIETGSPGAIATRDVTPPVIAPVADVTVEATSATGAIVTFAAPTTQDDVDGPGVATCAPASGTLFALGATTVTCTATDVAGNEASSAFTVTVKLLPPPATPDGRMFGIGHVDEGGQHHHFAFRMSEIGTRDFGRFEYWLRERRSCDRDDDDYDGHRDRDGHHDRDYGRPHQKTIGRFEATSIASIVFSDDPAFRPGRGWPFFNPPRVDSVTFTGTGKWNGKPGYTFKVTATDQGEPGRRRDTFTLLIEDSRGRIVARVDGELDRGNIQSTRLLGFWGLINEDGRRTTHSHQRP